ncbi:DUF2125 domain-containing protein [Microvirga thermotolerans]|uniref:DUF2125 domain-containing protein n=1 Tax=Microvirga thermotolerans TaxID=2651334 RepID=A0A5P9K2I0_9HYPH|nr:DUF2125 domain-containing protein [Microvirga thermotolerans]QFU17835.1 DUF2125 domain-containing protein [Microvirga thermotolerans]
MGEAPAENRSSRFWLYTPFVLLVLVAVGWSAAWLAIRSRASDSIDAWFGLEAKAGRQWTCSDRTVGGFPFRIEVTCGALSLTHGAVTASFGRVEAVAQVYQPRFVITEIEGPFRWTDGTVAVEGRWDLLQTSVHATAAGLQRLSAVARNPSVTVTGLTPDPVAVSGRAMELHVRPDPARGQERAYDVAFSVEQAKVPLLDGLIGGAEPTDLQADLTVSQAEGFRGRPLAEELERWRSDGGRLTVEMLSVSKGARRMEAKGELGLDPQHRPAGLLNVSAAGLDGLLGAVTGNRAGGALLGALLGQAPRPSGNAARPGQPALAPLPPLRLDGGFVALGPFVIPGLKLPSLY